MDECCLETRLLAPWLTGQWTTLDVPINVDCFPGRDPPMISQASMSTTVVRAEWDHCEERDEA